MKDKLKEAERMARFWTNRLCALQGVNAVNVNAKEGKEKEARKEELPPTPPIGEKREEKGKEEIVSSRSRTHEMFFYHPTFEQALAHAVCYLGPDVAKPEIVRDWFKECEMSCWHDGNNNPIRNWGRHLCLFIKYEPVRRRRLKPDNRKGGSSRIAAVRHADNWRGTNPEDLENVF